MKPSRTNLNSTRIDRRLKLRADEALRTFRQSLSSFDAIPQLALLGVLSGLLTGVVILIFRAAIEWPLQWLLPNGSPEGFESLDPWLRCLLPVVGALVVGLLLYRQSPERRRLGVAHVMERLANHQGYLSFRGAVLQFLCATSTILSGQSAGREGPAVHLGAASSSLLGQWLGLPNNTIRLLVGCGVAAAISASFNTPIAGVIFAMEVVIMDYTINSFMPVILAAVTAALVTQLVYGDDAAFSVVDLSLQSFWELPYILAIAILLGMSSAAFVRLLVLTRRTIRVGLIWRLLAAGLLTGLIAMVFPQIMGVGYDTVNLAIAGELTFLLLLGVGLAKLLATSIAVGLGMPSGIIGPALFIGACLGGAMGVLAQSLMPTLASSPGFYALLGMAAMMGALLQAPLAAITAVMELTRNSSTILPTMLIVVCASSIAAHFFRQKSVFETLLQEQGLDLRNAPLSMALRRASVGALMERSFVRCPQWLTREEIAEVLKERPRWLLIDGDQAPRSLMPASDLARFVEDGVEPLLDTVDLMTIPAQRRDVAPLGFQATLEEALEVLQDRHVEALYVERTAAPLIKPIVGIVTRGDLENYYQYRG